MARSLQGNQVFLHFFLCMLDLGKWEVSGGQDPHFHRATTPVPDAVGFQCAWEKKFNVSRSLTNHFWIDSDLRTLNLLPTSYSSYDSSFEIIWMLWNSKKHKSTKAVWGHEISLHLRLEATPRSTRLYHQGGGCSSKTWGWPCEAEVNKIKTLYVPNVLNVLYKCMYYYLNNM